MPLGMDLVEPLQVVAGGRFLGARDAGRRLQVAERLLRSQGHSLMPRRKEAVRPVYVKDLIAKRKRRKVGLREREIRYRGKILAAHIDGGGNVDGNRLCHIHTLS